jgi:hypothetical protein
VPAFLVSRTQRRSYSAWSDISIGDAYSNECFAGRKRGCILFSLRLQHTSNSLSREMSRFRFRFQRVSSMAFNICALDEACDYKDLALDHGSISATASKLEIDLEPGTTSPKMCYDTTRRWLYCGHVQHLYGHYGRHMHADLRRIPYQQSPYCRSQTRCEDIHGLCPSCSTAGIFEAVFHGARDGIEAE